MERLTKVLIKPLLAMFLVCSNLAFSGEFPADIQKILDKKHIIIAMYEQDQPPFFRTDENGTLEGFDVELGLGIANALGVEAVFMRTPKTFNGTVDLVVNKEADIVISKLSKTLARSKKVFFTQPYVVLRKGLLINRLKLAKQKKGRSTIEVIKSLTGGIGVIEGSSYVGYSKQMFPKAKIVEFLRWEDVTKAVVEGEIVAGFRDELEIKRFLKTATDQAIKLESMVFKDTKDMIAIAVSSDAPHLLYWLNQYLESLELHMTADKLLARYSHMLQNNKLVEAEKRSE